MKKSIILTMFTITLFSCQENKDCCEGINTDAQVEISVVDKEGNDLLNPNTENSIGYNDIRVYYEIEGKITEVNNPLMDAPKGFSILEPEDDVSNYLMVLSMNIEEESESTITYIEWVGSRRDTIESVYESRSYHSIVCTKLLFNGNVVWDVSNSETWQNVDGLRFFQIEME